MTVGVILVLALLASAGCLVLGLVRWGRRLPKTQQGWTDGIAGQDAAFRRAVCEVALEHELNDLAGRAAAYEGEWFPVAEFLQEMPRKLQSKVMRLARDLAKHPTEASG